MPGSTHSLTPRNLAGLEQDVGCHLTGWLSIQDGLDPACTQHSTVLQLVQSRHAILTNALQVTLQAISALQNDPDPKNEKIANYVWGM